MFVTLAAIANMGIVPQYLVDVFTSISRWCLVIAIAALGIKTSLAKFVHIKPSYGIILVVETLFLLLIAVLFVVWGGI